MKGVIFRILSIIVISAILTTSSAIADVSLWGSTTCQKRFLEPGADALKDKTGLSIKVYGVGSGKGVLALIEGKTNVAISSNNLEDSIKSAQKVQKKYGKPPVEIPKEMKYHMITEDVIVPIVNIENPVTALSWEQLSDLNTGAVKNWKEVGGPDLPVKIITSHAGSSTRAVFQKMVMRKAEYAFDAIKVMSTRLEINEVSKHKGGIGAVSAGFFRLNPARTKIVKTNEIKRPLGLITIGTPNPDVQKIIDFFRSDEGKKYIQ